MKRVDSYIILISLIVLAMSTSNCSKSKETIAKSNGTNNSIISDHNSSTSFGSTSSNVKIIFNGNDNSITFKSTNSKFKSKNNESVIIMDGTNNHLTFNSQNRLDISEDKKDTLVVNGRGNQFEFIDSNVIDASKSSNKKEVISGYYRSQIFPSSNLLLIEGDQSIGMELLNKQYLRYGDAYNDFDSLATIGNPKHQFYIGQIHHYGLDTVTNCVEAVSWYMKSAENQYDQAQFILGYLNETGECGVRTDKKKAKYWYKLATEKGNELAKQRLEKL